MAYDPTPTLIGTVGTGNVLAARRPLDVSNDIAYYNPNANPFFLLCQKADSASVKDPEFKTLEAQMQPVFDRINSASGHTAVGTSWTVDNGNRFKANDLVLNTRTNEIVLVSSVATNTLTVVRGYGSEAAAAVLDNDELRRVGNCFEEGGVADSVKTVKVDAITNYCQIFKTAVEITRTHSKTTLYGGPDLAVRRKMAAIEHAMKLESAFLFGQTKEYLTTSSTNATTSHPKRLTGGILHFISSNKVSITTLTEHLFNDTFLRPMFEADLNFRQKRVVFVAPKVAGIINMWAIGKLQMVPADKTYGIQVRQYLSAHGEVQLIQHPLLKGDTYAGYMIGVDMSTVGYRFLDDTKLEQDIVKDGTDQTKDQYLTEAGFMIRLEGVHGYAYGITS